LVPPMLAGLLLLLDESPRAARRALAAGALFGAAAALKYSNAIYALAALALLMREFGNPVFPLMNGWFQSPYAPAVNMVSERFTPAELTAVLSFPFRMIALDRGLYSENFAPDIRFAALLAAAVALPLVAARRNAPRERALRGADWRVFAFFGASLVLWLASSANARYGLIVLLIAGRLLPAGIARTALAVLLVVQVGASVMASPPRWFIAEPWSLRWLPYDVPERALREPALYVTVEVLPMAVIAPFVHPASSFVNFRGQHSIPSDSPKLAALLERHRD